MFGGSSEIMESERVDADFLWETPHTLPTSSDYIFVDGKRIVRPYFFEFIAHVKKRWAGKNVVDLFANEFRQRPFEYYVSAVDCGRIRVNGQKVGKNYIVHAAQRLSHFLHRHEPPVTAGSLTILHETEDVITVCKPPSIPVHPCGQYRKNTVLGILQAEHKSGNLFPIHRLDRLVSGLLILAKNAATANYFREEIQEGHIRKEYIAKVKGVFPQDEVLVDAAIIYNARDGRSKVQCLLPTDEAARAGDVKDDESFCSESGVKGKPAVTRFQRLSTDGKFSIVRCMPLTGRTHQIRVHLQFLGHPIGNDALYLYGDPAKRLNEGTTADIAAKRSRAQSLSEMSHLDIGNSSHSKLPEDLPDENHALESSGGHGIDRFLFEGVEFLTCQSNGSSLCISKDTSVTGVLLTDLGVSDATSEKELLVDDLSKILISKHALDNSSKSFILDPMCTHCPKLEPSGYETSLEGLWLHCVKYSSFKWSYDCPVPNWAL